jgi:hypothetical protein
MLRSSSASSCARLMLDAWSRSFESSCWSSGDEMSERADSNWPSFTKVGPSSSSASRTCRGSDLSCVTSEKPSLRFAAYQQASAPRWAVTTPILRQRRSCGTNSSRRPEACCAMVLDLRRTEGLIRGSGAVTVVVPGQLGIHLRAQAHATQDTHRCCSWDAGVTSTLRPGSMGCKRR